MSRNPKSKLLESPDGRCPICQSDKTKVICVGHFVESWLLQCEACGAVNQPAARVVVAHRIEQMSPADRAWLWGRVQNNDHLTKLWQEKAALEAELKNIVSTYRAHEVHVEDCDRSGREDDCLEKAIARASRLVTKPAKEGGESL